MSVNPCYDRRTLQLNILLQNNSIAPSTGYDYTVLWRPVGEEEYNTVNQRQNPVVIPNVPACKSIEGIVKVLCLFTNTTSQYVFGVTVAEKRCRRYTLTQNAVYSFINCVTDNGATVSNSSNNPTIVCALQDSVTGGEFIDHQEDCSV